MLQQVLDWVVHYCCKLFKTPYVLPALGYSALTIHFPTVTAPPQLEDSQKRGNYYFSVHSEGILI